MEITNKEIKEHLEAKLKKLEEEYKKTKLALDAFSNDSDVEVPKNSTVLLKITTLLGEIDAPVTSRELMEKYNQKYTDKKYSLTSFSGRLSQLHDKVKKESKIRIFEVSNTPINLRYFYCLKDWFDGQDSLKERYQNMLKKRGVL